MTVVKICGLTNLADALAAAEAGADLLGFVLVPSSPRAITIEQAAEVVAALRARGVNVPCVGVVAGLTPSQALAARERARLDLLQVHDEDAEALAAALHPAVIVARRVEGAESLPGLARIPAFAYLLDSRGVERRSGAVAPWAWGLLHTAGLPGRVIVAGGLDPWNVAGAVRAARPYGVDVASGVESAPGRKDRAAVTRFIRAVREVDNEYQC